MDKDISRLAKRRKLKNLTQKQLSEQTGISINTIKSLESKKRGGTNHTQGEILYILAKRLGCRMEDIIEVDEINWRTDKDIKRHRC